jgi:hypothetical protein
VLGLDGLEFDGNLFARDDVGAKIDVTEATAADLAANTVLVTNTKILKYPSVCVPSRARCVHLLRL